MRSNAPETIFSATDFLPACMIEFINFETTWFPYLGSGFISRFSALWRRDIASTLGSAVHFPGDPYSGPVSLIPSDYTPKRLAVLGSFRSFCSIFRAPLFSILDPLGVEHAAQNVVAHSRQILHPTAPDHHHRVLLQIVTFARNVANHLEPIGQPNLGHFAQCRIRLLGRGGIDPGTYAAPLRALLERRHLLFRMLRNTRLADELVDRRHRFSALAPWSVPSSSSRDIGLLSTSQRAKRKSALRADAFGARPFTVDRSAKTRGSHALPI